MSRPRRIFAVYAVVGAVLSSLAVAAFTVGPRVRYYLLKEDYALESMALALFLASAVVGARQVLVRRPRSRWYYAIPILGLVGALEEISYGRWYFDLDMPYVHGLRIDSLHDFAELSRLVLEDYVSPAAPAIVGVVLGAVLCVWLYAYHERVLRTFRRHPSLTFAAAAVCLLGMAGFLDLGMLPSSLELMLCEELGEMLAALAWVFAAAAIHVDPRG